MKTPSFDINFTGSDSDITEFDAIESENHREVERSFDVLTADDKADDQLSSLLSAAEHMLAELDKPADNLLPFGLDGFRTREYSSSPELMCEKVVASEVSKNHKHEKITASTGVGEDVVKTKSRVACDEHKRDQQSLKEKSRSMVSMYIPNEPLKLFSDGSFG